MIIIIIIIFFVFIWVTYGDSRYGLFFQLLVYIFFLTFTSSTIHDYSQNPFMVHEKVGSEDSGYI